MKRILFWIVMCFMLTVVWCEEWQLGGDGNNHFQVVGSMMKAGPST